MATKTYLIDFEWWDAKLIIEDVIAKDTIVECVDYFTEELCTDDYQDADGDYVLAFVKIISRYLIPASMNYSLYSLQMHYFTNMEGFMLKLDGSSGILLSHCDEYTFDFGSVSVTEVNE